MEVQQIGAGVGIVKAENVAGLRTKNTFYEQTEGGCNKETLSFHEALCSSVYTRAAQTRRKDDTRGMNQVCICQEPEEHRKHSQHWDK